MSNPYAEEEGRRRPLGSPKFWDGPCFGLLVGPWTLLPQSHHRTTSPSVKRVFQGRKTGL